MTVNVEEMLLIVMLQLILIIASARLFGMLFRKFGQPQVCGEIAAGLILGPSLFGKFFPGISAYVFTPSVGPIFGVISQIGLIFLLFLIGLEFDFGHLKEYKKASFTISAVGIILPFSLGTVVAQLLYPYVGEGINQLGFTLFIATSISITALPILGRIMVEFNISRTPVGAVTITAAAIDDVAGWIILAAVSGIVKSGSSSAQVVVMGVESVIYGAFMLFIARPYLIRWTRRALEQGKGELSLNTLAIVIILVFTSAIITHLIGLFSIFGAFMMGAILSNQDNFVKAVKQRLWDFVTVFFLPIFFTYTGLRTDIGIMQGKLLWGLCFLVLFVSILGKLGGGTVAARLSGFSWRESFSVGIMMNTRALMELIVVNIGYDLGVIPLSVFFMLVFMAVVTTFMTSPLLTRAILKTNMERHFHESEFVAQCR